MHGACSLPGLAAAWALQATTRLAVAPFSLKAIAPELPPVDWESWRKENIPWAASPDRWVIGLPADPRRRRFHILLLDESHRQVGFAKFSTNPLAEFAVRVREHLNRSDPSTFWTPRLLAHGAVSGWHFTVDSAMPEGFHRPARLAPERRRAILDEIRGILRQGLGSDVVHGDFGPWNVRSIKGHPVIVLDWEDASPGSAGMDELWHAVNVGLMGSLDVTGTEVAEHLDRVTLEQVGVWDGAGLGPKERQQLRDEPRLDLGVAPRPGARLDLEEVARQRGLEQPIQVHKEALAAILHQPAPAVFSISRSLAGLKYSR